MKYDVNQATRSSRRNFLTNGATALLAAGALSELPAEAEVPPTATWAAGKYVCPPCGQPCDKPIFENPGTCPQCGMTLVPLGGGPDSPATVAILLFNGAELIDFAGPWEVFGTAGFLVHTVAESKEPLTIVFGQKVIPDYTFDNSPKANILLVPGGGVFNYLKNERMMGWLQSKAKEVDHVMSVCTGAFLLQKAGLLAGQTVTATYGMIEDLAAPDTKVVYDQRFVDSGKIITTAGLSSGIDGAFHLVSKMLGTGAAQSAALSMEYPWNIDSKWARASLADRYLPDGLAFGTAKLKGIDAKLISTEGDTDKWEIKMLVSSPDTPQAVAEVIRDRIGACTGSQGMFKPISHIKGSPTLSPKSGDGSNINWTFTDDQGRNWSGVGTVQPAPNDAGKSVANLKLARVNV